MSSSVRGPAQQGTRTVLAPASGGETLPRARKADLAGWLAPAALVAIMALALAVRLAGVVYGYPFLLDGDENLVYATVLRMLSHHSIDPHFYFYGPFLQYIDILWLLPYIGVQTLRGYSAVPDARNYANFTGTTTDPTMLVYARLPFVFLAVLTVWLAYVVGRRIGGRLTGLLAALFVALSPLDISESPIILPNLFLALFALLTLWPTVLYLEQPGLLLRPAWAQSAGWTWVTRLRHGIGGEPRYLLLAAAVAGAGAAMKANAVTLLAVPILAAVLTDWNDKKRWVRQCALLCCIAGAAFVILTPTLFITPYQVAHWIGFQMLKYSHVSAGIPGPPLVWNGLYLMQNEGFLLLPIAVIGLACLWLRERRPVDLLVLLVILVLYAFIGIQREHFPRNLLLLTPFVAVGGAYVIARLARARLRGARLLSAAVTGLILWQLTAGTSALERQLTGPQPQLQARAWLQSHLPAGAHLLADGYTVPPLNRRNVRVTYVIGVSLPPDQLSRRGITYAAIDYDLAYYCNPGNMQHGSVWMSPVKVFPGMVIFHLVRGAHPPPALSCG